MNQREVAQKIYDIIDSKKGIDIQIVELMGKTSIADYFVIATGTSTPHIRSLADEVEIKLKEEGLNPIHTEGRESGRWVLLDYGDIIVHIFHEEDREFYSLEKLWETRRGKIQD